MKTLINIVFVLSLVLVGNTIFAQDFNGIIPIKSTCKDVKKIFPDVNCRKSDYTFETKEEKVRIVFTTKKCQAFFSTKWNVPVGTVIFVDHNYNRIIKKVTLEDLGILIDERDYNKNTTDVDSIFYYEKKTAGHSIGMADGFVDSILYTPTLSDAESNTCRGRTKW
jgi:hypothetical protein